MPILAVLDYMTHYRMFNYFGQVVCRGRNVFMGYLGNEEKTNETIDDERWLHSGDLGWLDDVSIHICIS